MQAFVTSKARAYGKARNFDCGRAQHRAVSRLAPYLRYRLITEKELIAYVLDQVGANQGRSFIDEVLWRSY